MTTTDMPDLFELTLEIHGRTDRVAGHVARIESTRDGGAIDFRRAPWNNNHADRDLALLDDDDFDDDIGREAAQLRAIFQYLNGRARVDELPTFNPLTGSATYRLSTMEVPWMELREYTELHPELTFVATCAPSWAGPTRYEWNRGQVKQTRLVPLSATD